METLVQSLVATNINNSIPKELTFVYNIVVTQIPHYILWIFFFLPFGGGYITRVKKIELSKYMKRNLKMGKKKEEVHFFLRSQT